MPRPGRSAIHALYHTSPPDGNTIRLKTSVGWLDKSKLLFAVLIALLMLCGLAMSEETIVCDAGSEAFEETDVQKVVIPATVTGIGSRAFADCADLILAAFEGNPVTFAETAFADAHGISWTNK